MVERDKIARMALDKLARSMREAGEAPNRFFEAWKEGVVLAGPDYFGPKTPEAATNKNDLRPIIPAIDYALPYMGSGEAQFICALVSFFNPQLGERFSSRLNTEQSVCGLTLGIDGDGRKIVAMLISYYCGW